jgi:hypothetical protein
MAFACYTNERGTIGIFADRDQADRLNRGSGSVVEVTASLYVYSLGPRGVRFTWRDQSYPALAAMIDNPDMNREEVSILMSLDGP